MSTRTHKLLMILLSLALSVSPLRGVWALSMQTSVVDDSHCAQMQHDMNDAAAAMTMNHQDSGSGHPCNDDCDGTCCDGACTTCTPATPALSYTALVTPRTCSLFLNNISTDAFPERTIIPPLRPPAPLHG